MRLFLPAPSYGITLLRRSTHGLSATPEGAELAQEARALLAQLRARYPALRIELLAEDRVADLVTDGIDVALRTTVGNSEAVVARELGSFERRLHAVAPTGGGRRGPGRPGRGAGTVRFPHGAHHVRCFAAQPAQRGQGAGCDRLSSGGGAGAVGFDGWAVSGRNNGIDADDVIARLQRLRLHQETPREDVAAMKGLIAP